MADCCTAARTLVVVNKTVEATDADVLDVLELEFCGHHYQHTHAEKLAAEGWMVVHEEPAEPPRVFEPEMEGADCG